jgi:predicted CXXCH cytochrome family protein
LILTAAVGAMSLAAADFSHPRHLALQIPCTTCHAAATSSTKAADNLLPSAAVCAKCHDDKRTPRANPSPQLVAKFNHSLHAKLGNVAPTILAAIRKGTYLSPPHPNLAGQLATRNACEACHRALRESETVSKANFPAMADCLVCHNRIDPPDSCVQCHLPGPELKPASHTVEFIEAHSTRKIDKTGCAVCHGRDFTCQGCH